MSDIHSLPPSKYIVRWEKQTIWQCRVSSTRTVVSTGCWRSTLWSTDSVSANLTPHYFRPLSNKINSFHKEETVCLWDSRWLFKWKQFFDIHTWEKQTITERQMEIVLTSCCYLALGDNHPCISPVSAHLLSITPSRFIFSRMSTEQTALEDKNSMCLGGSQQIHPRTG